MFAAGISMETLTEYKWVYPREKSGGALSHWTDRVARIRQCSTPLQSGLGLFTARIALPNPKCLSASKHIYATLVNSLLLDEARASVRYVFRRGLEAESSLRLMACPPTLECRIWCRIRHARQRSVPQ